MTTYAARWPDGYEVSWRNLTWSEYKQFKDKYESSPFDEPMEIALKVYETCYLDGPDPRFAPAGIVGYICKQQMTANPFSGRYEDIAPALELARRAVEGDYLLCAKGLIAATLHYKPEELEKMDPISFFTRLAQAEVASGRVFNPVDPKAPKEDPQAPGKPKRPTKPISAAQQRAIDRTKERDRGA